MTTTGDEIQIVTFRVADQAFGLNVFQVERILRYERPAALPKAPDFLEGVVPFEGTSVPVVDLRKRLGTASALGDDVRMMVLDVEGQRVGIVVDQVLDVLRVDGAAIAAPPALVRGLAAEYISGLLTREGGRTVVILNAGRLLSSKERLALKKAGAA
ncbi:MAG TPA: chemotaxis protein CheW [Gemmatimonadales bacterium]|nr:chemotaxis protein CheW [Gemmatimonadales bacterium]